MDKAKSALPVIGGTLLILAAYVLARNFIYSLYPVNSTGAWFERDTLMTVPRLVIFAALWFANRFFWKATRIEMARKDFLRAMLLGFSPMILWTLYFSQSHGPGFPTYMKAIGISTSLVVGLFEEYAFRGLLLTGFTWCLTILPAIIVTNLLFCGYHIQAQPLESWGMIFLTGVVFANCRLRGLGLGWLVLIHGAIDALYFLFFIDTPHPFSTPGIVLHVGLLVCAIATYPRGKITSTQAAA